MHSLLNLLIGLSFAIAPTWAGESWKDITCPAPSTVSLSFTQYYPVTTTSTTTTTATTTQPITIYQTIIKTLTTTEIVTTTSTTVSTSPTTITATQYLTETSTTTSVSPTTATAYVTETSTTVSVSPTTATEYVTETSTTVSVSPTTATEFVTETSTTVSISPTTATQTLTETSTTLTVSSTTNTLTATKIISEYEITTKATSLTICPTRLVNPTYTALKPYPTDWTWGCPPGWLCNPTREGCNFEAGIPDRNFLCPPNHCIPASALPVPLQTWDVDIYGNSTPATNPGLTYNAIDRYFNMNPTEFGLTYQIFVVDEVLTITTTILQLPSPTVGARQAQTSIPGACYPWCNNCLLEAQSRGKTSALCVPGSAFEVSLVQCEQCIDYHKADGTANFVQIAPQFQQFLDYCDQFSTVVVSTSVTATTTNAAGSSTTMLTGTLSTTVTPRSSVTPTSSGPVVSVSTIVASTETLTPSSPTPYVTTQTGVTTTYEQSTITGPAWSSVTVLIPIGDNSTSTVYGSTLTSVNATLVLPVSSGTRSYTSTLTITPTELVSEVVGATSALSSTAITSGAGAGASSSATPSTFPGAASSFKSSTGDLYLRTMILGLAISLIVMVML